MTLFRPIGVILMLLVFFTVSTLLMASSGRTEPVDTCVWVQAANSNALTLKDAACLPTSYQPGDRD